MMEIQILEHGFPLKILDNQVDRPEEIKGFSLETQNWEIAREIQILRGFPFRKPKMGGF